MQRLTIVVTGAAILALQLIASRIMAPFFGVSLFIWTGILSITLLCLAAGYYLGGVYTRRAAPQAARDALYLLCAISSFAVTAAALAYPALFGPLARFDLATGSFVACVVLLAVPLTALSALNPLLVAIERDGRSSTDDGGAGHVFFISTLGSVGGVLIAALLLIPSLTNAASLSLIAATLSLLAVVGAARRPRRIAILILGAIGLMVAAAPALTQPRPGSETVDARGWRWKTVATYPSPFGALRVADLDTGRSRQRMLVNDGIVHNAIYPDGASATVYTYMLDIAASTLAPDAQRALVLGAGAGIIPQTLAGRGIRVDAVDINPRMFEAARAYFGFDPERHGVAEIVADARTFVHDASASYDVVFVDLFAGDGVPEHLVTAEFMRDIRRRLAPNGVVAMNAFIDLDHPAYANALLATVAETFGAAATFSQVRADGVSLTNGFIVAAADPARLRNLANVSVALIEDAPAPLRPGLRAALGTLDIAARGDARFVGAARYSDAFNSATTLAIPGQLAYRRSILGLLPADLLAN